MRDGRIRGGIGPPTCRAQQIVAEMIGEAAGAPSERAIGRARRCRARDPGPRRLRAGGQDARVDGLDLTVRKGEMVGLFGLLGAGCIEAALAIYGAWPGTARRRRSSSTAPKSTIDSPDDAVALGLGLIAQDRRDCLIGDHSIADNIGIASLDKVVRDGVARHRPLGGGARRTRSMRLQHQGRVDRRRGAHALRRQPAEGAGRALAGRRCPHPAHDRPDARRRCRRPREIKRDLVRAGRAGAGDPAASTDAEELVGCCDRVVVMRAWPPCRRARRRRLTERNLLRMATDG